MDRLDDLRLLVRIIETGSLSAAAREARTTQPTVSKRLRALEAAVGHRLMHRNTRHVVPTEAGLSYYRYGKRWLAELEELEHQLKPQSDSASGLLRINAAVTVGAYVLTPIIARYQKLHPTVKFELDLTDRRVDLVEERVDIAVRIYGMGNPDLIATALGSYTFAVVAHPSWVARHPQARTLEGLKAFPLMTYEATPTSRVDGPGGPTVLRRDNRLALVNSIGLRQLAREYDGPLLLARMVVDEDLRRGELIELVPGATSAPIPVFAVTLPERPIPPKIKTFLAFLKREVHKVPGWIPP